MKMKKKQSIKNFRSLIIAILLLYVVQLQSQQMGIEVTTGISGLNYEMSKGSSNLRWGGSIGGVFSYPLTKSVTMEAYRKWSVLSGLHLGFYRTELSLPKGTYVSNQIDSQNSAFEFRTTLSNYQEKQRMVLLSIPIMIQYSKYATDTSSKYVAFHFAGGMKWMIPVSQLASASSDTVSLTGYYPNVNVEVDDLASRGFGTLNNLENNDIDTDITGGITLSLQGGVDFRLGKSLFYTGLYVDYGLKNLTKDTEENIVKYSPKGLNDSSFNGISNSFLAKETRLLSFGLTLRMYVYQF